VNAICTQCHCAEVPLFPNGAGTWNSREGWDLEAGACATAIKCTDCHDPHRPGPPEGTDQIDQVAACVKCHSSYADPARATKHAGHPASAAVSCLDCHMPRISQGLEEVVRSHRISSPTDRRMLAAGAPNACNLCHLDRSISWTLDALAKGWGKRIEPETGWATTYGSLEAPAGKAWLASKDPFARNVASQAYARSPLGKAALPELLTTLEDPVPVNRVFGTFAVERVTGAPLGERYDVVAPPEVRHRQVEALKSGLH
jgi:predicted CXXCH cytochrome family protein